MLQRERFIQAIFDLNLDYKKFTKQIFQNEESANEFLKLIPTAYVFHILNEARNTNFNRPIEPNDLWDLGTLAIAILYCDVVVAEKQQANILNNQKRGELYGTIITHDLKNLSNILE